jgi:hypothetical protein
VARRAPFLTSAYTYVHLPPIEEFELATAMLFDLGVFLTVLGAVMLMLYSLSRIARFAGETVNVGADGLRPRRGPRPGRKGGGGPEMEIIVASTVGVLTAGGVYLLLRLRTFPVILGLALLSYAVNVFLFASGRLAIDHVADPVEIRRCQLYRPAAAGAGADGHRDLLRDDGGAGDDRARRLSEAESDRIDIEPTRPPTPTETPRMMHWIIVPVVLPAMLAPLIGFVMRHDITLARTASVAGTVALLAVAGAAVLAAGGETHVYRLGDWPAPFGIVLVLDRLSALMVLLTALLALIVLIHAIATGWDARGRHFHALFQFQLMGICGAFLTGDVFNLFVFFEVLLIASYGLMIHSGGRERMRAGLQYVVMNLAGSTLFLFALGTLYASTGHAQHRRSGGAHPRDPAEEAALVRVAAML